VLVRPNCAPRQACIAPFRKDVMSAARLDSVARAATLGEALRSGTALRWLKGLRARIVANMVALLVGQGVTAGIQLVSLPLFLLFWDAERYGKWVLLSAVPAYFSMSDAGMIPVAANKVSMLRASGRTTAANAVFQSALVLVLMAFTVVGASSAFVLLNITNDVLDADSRLALWLLILSTLLGLFSGLFGASFRAAGNNARGVLYNESIRALEFTGLAIGLALGRTYTFAALGLLTGRFAGSLLVANECRRLCPFLHWSVRLASRAELHALIRPALGYLAFPLGNGLSIQAITLVVGALFGAVTVAIFNTYRTLSRLVLQITSTLSHAVLPEFSNLYGASDATALRALYHRAVLAGGALSIFLSLVMIPCAPIVLRIWTHDKIPFDTTLFVFFALATLISALAHVPRILLLSTNRHSRLGILYLAFSATGVVSAVLLGRLFGPSGTVFAMTAPELGMLLLAVIMGRRLLREMPESPKNA